MRYHARVPTQPSPLCVPPLSRFNQFLASVPTHQHSLMMRFNQALLPSPERCACHRSPDSSSRRFSCRWFCQVLAKMRSDSLHGVTCCTLFASLALLLLSSPVMIHHSKGFTRCRTVSTSTTNSDNCLFISILTDSGATSLQHVSHHLEVRKTPHKMWLDSGLPTDSCSTNPVRQRCKLNLVQPIQGVLLLVYQHSQVLKDVRTLALHIRHHLSYGLFQIIDNVRQISFHAVTRCALVASLSLINLIFRQVSCFSVPHIGRRLDSTFVPSSCGGSVGFTVSRIPMLQMCSAVVVLKTETGFVPASAHLFAVKTFLMLRSPSCTRSCTRKKWCVNVFRSRSCSQPIRQRI